jgi:hypothetical protein
MVAGEKTFSELGEEVQSEQNTETTQEDTTASKDTEQVSQEQATDGVSDELDKDPEFLKASQDLGKEMGGKISFGQSKRFKEIYRLRKDAERKAKDLETQIEELSNRELSEDELTQLAQSKGYTLTKAQQQAQAQQDKLDELEALYQNATPQEREWWSKHDKAIFSKFEKSLEERYGNRDKVMLEMITDNLLEKSEKQARKHIADLNTKYGLKLDYDKDIYPEITKMVKGLKMPGDQLKKAILDGRINLLAFTKEYLADNGIELGRKLSAKEMQEITDKKKKANVETSSNSGGAPMADENKSVQEIMKEEARSQGVSSFV